MRALPFLAFFLLLPVAAVQAASEVEPNNDSTTATPLPALTPITGTQSDDDWYAITVPTGIIHLIVDLTFTHAEGDIQMEVYTPTSPSDPTLFREELAISSDDNEFVDNPNFATNGTTNYIRVYGHSGNGDKDNEYTLTWTYLTADDDVYEPNDNISAAAALSAATPANVTTTAGDAEVALSWDAVAEADAYTVYWNTTGSVTSNDNSIDAGANTQITHSALTNGTTYYYRVVANKSDELIFAVLGENEDWYSIYVQPGTQTLDVYLKHKLITSNGADINFELRDAGGTSIASSVSAADENEVLNVDFVTAGLTEGTYNIQVTGPTATSDGRPTGYTLAWEGTSTSPIVSSGSSALSAEVSAAPAAAVTPTAPASSGGGGALSPLSMVVMLALSLVSLTRRFSHLRSSN